jgi:hypothetical protein
MILMFWLYTKSNSFFSNLLYCGKTYLKNQI